MHLKRDVMVFRALLVLDEAVQACEAAPIKPGLGIRFALTFLYAVSCGERRCYDEFWQEVQDPKPWAYTPAQASYVRGTAARGCLVCIARGVGAPLTPQFFQSLRRARLPREERDRLRMAELVREQSVMRMREMERERAARDCGLSG